MPLKNFASKAFPRRKSSGNALEDLEKDSSEGFRVLSQNEVAVRKHDKQEKERTKSSGRLSGVRPFASPAQKARQQSFDDDSGTSNRGSNGSSTANSALSRFYDNSSSSARFSSSSTLPSSTEQDNDDLFGHKGHGENNSFSLRNAARTFTLGGRSHKSMNPHPPKPSLSQDELSTMPQRGHLRERSLTTNSSASTAHPPKVEAGLALGISDFGGEFDDLFAGLDKRQSSVMKDLPKPPPLGITRSESEPTLAVPPKAFASSRQMQTPNPITIDKNRDIPNSPYSWDSRNSNDGLMSSPRSADSMAPDGPPVPPHRQFDARLPAPSNAVQRKPISGTSTSSRQSSENSYSVVSSEKPGPPAPPARADPLLTPPVGLFDSNESASLSNDATPRPNRQQSSARTPTADSGFVATSTTAASSSSRPGAKKVMNQAEFNQYRVHKEQAGVNGEASSESEESDGDYEDDEEERTKELQRQRRKQEGHLAVWRQQMHKVTGERPNPVQRTSSERPASQFDNGMAAPVRQGKDDSDSGDEETPLAILMAHGFPTKTRPPNKPSGPYASKLPVESHSTTDLRLSVADRTYSAPTLRPGSSPGPRPNSAVGSQAGDRRTALPVFARGLPQDPYFGASLVTPATRESLAFGGTGPGSVYGGHTGHAPHHGNTSGQSNTLVNVIASEERAKAMRRGSPNAQLGFGIGQPNHPPSNNFGMSTLNPPMQQQMQQMPMQMNMGMGMGAMGMGMGMGNNQMHMQSQSADMSQAMAQLMMNQQLLQQQLAQSQQMMMHMASGQINPGQVPMSGLAPPMQGMPGMHGMPGMGGMPGMMGQNRPMSIYSNAGAVAQQRTMSMVGPPQLPMLNAQQGRGYAPSVANMNLAPPQLNGYAPSIAPSERSTIGMARRYRPVTQQPADGVSSISSNTLHAPNGLSVNTQKPGESQKKKSILGVLKRNNKENEAQDDDDEGWGALSSRKSKWGGKVNTSASNQGLRELYVGDGI